MSGLSRSRRTLLKGLQAASGQSGAQAESIPPQTAQLTARPALHTPTQITQHIRCGSRQGRAVPPKAGCNALEQTTGRELAMSSRATAPES